MGQGWNCTKAHLGNSAGNALVALASVVRLVTCAVIVVCGALAETWVMQTTRIRTTDGCCWLLRVTALTVAVGSTAPRGRKTPGTLLTITQPTSAPPQVRRLQFRIIQSRRNRAWAGALHTPALLEPRNDLKNRPGRKGASAMAHTCGSALDACSGLCSYVSSNTSATRVRPPHPTISSHFSQQACAP